MHLARRIHSLFRGLVARIRRLVVLTRIARIGRTAALRLLSLAGPIDVVRERHVSIPHAPRQAEGAKSNEAFQGRKEAFQLREFACSLPTLEMWS